MRISDWSSDVCSSDLVDNRSTVDYWLPQVRESRIRDTIAHLSSYQNRYYASPAGKASAEWIRDSWAALAAGRSDVTTELFTACATCSTQPSVVLTIEGTTLREEVVVLGAHLDSINAYGGGSPGQAAPGADDDASGIAVLTETLRIALASGWRPQRTVKFMRSEEHTSELQSLMRISYAVFCLKKKTKHDETI